MKRKIPLILLCLLFLGIAGYFGTRFYLEWNEYRVGEKAYEELSQYVHLDASPTAELTQPKKKTYTAWKTSLKDTESTETPEDTEPTETPEDTEPTEVPDDTIWPVVDFDALHEINQDVIAWIYIEGTNINYPVVQGVDNNYYLERLLDGTYNAAGTIFLDYRNESDFSDRNSVFYGHHMQNGTIFHQIAKYKEQSFYDAHPVCLIMTPNGNFKVEFFAGYVVNLNGQAWKTEFASDEEFAGWLDEAVSKSTFTSAVEPTAQDRVLTLSTCSYEYDNARFVLLGILKP